MVRKYDLICLVSCGTVLLFVGTLFGLTPTNNRLPDALIFAVASVCFALTLVIGRRRMKLVGIGVISFELIACVWLFIDAYTHLHAL